MERFNKARSGVQESPQEIQERKARQKAADEEAARYTSEFVEPARKEFKKAIGQYYQEKAPEMYLMARAAEERYADSLAKQYGVRRGLPHILPYDESREHDPEFQKRIREAARGMSDDDAKAIYAAKDYYKTAYDNYRKGKRINDLDEDASAWSRFLSGVKTAFNGGRDLYTLGIGSIADMWKAKNALERMQEGKGTEADRILVNSLLDRMTAEELYDPGIAGQIGQGAYESLKFMLDMALTGGIGGAAIKGGKALLSAIAKKSGKEIGKEAVETAAKSGARQFARQIGKDVAKSAVGSTVSPMVYNETLRRQNENYLFGRDENGEVTVRETADPESMAESFAQALLSNNISRLVERGVGPVMEKGVQAIVKPLAKITPEWLKFGNNFLSNLGRNVKDWMSVQGFLPEYGEEFVEELLTRALVDQTAREKELGVGKWDDLFSPEWCLVTVGSVAVIQAAIGLPGFAASTSNAAGNSARMRKYMRNLPDNLREEVGRIASMEDDNQRAQALSEVLKRSTDSQRRDILGYITARAANNLGLSFRRAEAQQQETEAYRQTLMTAAMDGGNLLIATDRNGNRFAVKPTDGQDTWSVAYPIEGNAEDGTLQIGKPRQMDMGALDMRNAQEYTVSELLESLSNRQKAQDEAQDTAIEQQERQAARPDADASKAYVAGHEFNYTDPKGNLKTVARGSRIVPIATVPAGADPNTMVQFAITKPGSSVSSPGVMLLSDFQNMMEQGYIAAEEQTESDTAADVQTDEDGNHVTEESAQPQAEAEAEGEAGVAKTGVETAENEILPQEEAGETATVAEEVVQPQTSFISPIDMSDSEKERRGNMLKDAPVLNVSQNQITATNELSARKAAEKWWDENVQEPVFYVTEAGEVEINRNSIESSLAHRYSQAKLDAITSLVDGFENAVYLGTLPDSRERGVLDHYFAYPIDYNGERCYVFCRAMQDGNKNRLYVHEVFVADKIKKGDTLQTAASKPHGGIALYKDILANVLDEDKGTQVPSEKQVQLPVNPVAAQWNALVDDNEGDEAEALDTAVQMVGNKTSELEKARNEKTTGKTVEAIQAAKRAKREKVSTLETELRFWQDVAGYPEKKRAMAEAARKQNERLERERKRRESGAVNPNYGLRQTEADDRLGAPLSLREYIIRKIATGRVKFLWGASESGTGGLKEHGGVAKRQMLYTDKTRGAYPEDVAEAMRLDIVDNYPEFGTVEAADILSEIENLAVGEQTPSEMMDEAERLHERSARFGTDETLAEAAQEEAAIEEARAEQARESVSGLTEEEYAAVHHAAPRFVGEMFDEDGRPKREASEVERAIASAEAQTDTNPTEGQKAAGNYRKGHVKVNGFDITIENPKGSERSGVDGDGRAWRQTMNNTYGYIRGTEGVDGDHIDVFLSDTPETGDVFVIDQVNPKTGAFDEHKVMMGFDSEAAAREAYLSNYEDGWQGLGGITRVSQEEFKKWIDASHRKTKPFADYKNVNVGENVAEKAQGVGNEMSFDEANAKLADIEAEWNEKILDYIYEHYPTQANVSAKTKSEQGLREREAMKNDEHLKQLRAEMKAAVEKADKAATEAYLREEAERNEQVRMRRGEEVEDAGLSDEERSIVERAKADGTYLKAPNGQPTKLSPKQWAQVRTKAFKDWFGDWELATKALNIVNALAEHGFKNFDEAGEWAEKHIVRTLDNEETGNKGKIRISKTAVGKFLSQSSVEKSENKDVHLSVLKVLPDVIRESIDVEQHPDYKKGDDGVRSKENGVNEDVTIHRLYGSVGIDGNTYRVKITLKEDTRNSKLPKGTYSYEATKIELLAGTLGKPNGDAPSTNNSISAAKLLQGVKKSNSNEEILNASKVVDENGEPLVVYHGTEARFSIFRHNPEDIGFHFGNKKIAISRVGRGRNARHMQTYISVKKPLVIDTDLGSWSAAYLVEYLLEKGKITKQEAAEILIIDSKINSIDPSSITANNVRFISDTYRRGDSYANAKIRHWLRSKGYDGIKYSNYYESDGKDSWIVFSSPQIKSATDNVGTFDAGNADIRFRRGETVEEKGNLVAVHNLSEDKIRQAFDLGGFPMPSIAITKSDIGHTEFGDISLVFDKESINPADKQNKVYGEDAWTPTFPEIGLKINNDVAESVQKKISEILGDQYGDLRASLYLDEDNLSETANRYDGDMAAAFADKDFMKQAYRKEKGLDKNPEREDKDYRKWIDDIFKGIIQKRGIRNNKDFFTPSGIARKWEDLYDNITLDNVVNAMKKKNAKGGQGLFGANIFGAAQEDYKSIDAIRTAARKRLRNISDAEIAEDRKAINDRLSAIKIPGAGDKVSDIFDMIENIQNAVSKSHTAKGIYNYLLDFYPDMTMEVAKEIEGVVKDIQKMGARYFEAKPYRAVDFGEVKLAVVPDNIDKSILERLKQLHIPVETYEHGNNEQRVRILNDVTEKLDLRFRFIGEKGAANLDKAEEATTRLDNLAVAREDQIFLNEALGTSAALEAEPVPAPTSVSAAAKREAAEALSKRLGVPVVIEDKTTPKGRSRRFAGVKGWFVLPSAQNPNGVIHVNVDNHASVADVERTMLHEVVAHMGMRKMMGEEKYNALLDKVYESMDAEARAYFEDYAAKDFKRREGMTEDAYRAELQRIAADEYIAALAEVGTDPTTWQKVVALVREALRALGFNLSLSEADIRALLYESKHNLESAAYYAEREMMRREQKEFRDEASLSNRLEEDEREMAGVRMRRAGTAYDPRLGVISIDADKMGRYDKWSRQGMYRRASAVARYFLDDSMPLRHLMTHIRRSAGGVVSSATDLWRQKTMVVSRARFRIDEYNRKIGEPLMESVCIVSEKIRIFGVCK